MRELSLVRASFDGLRRILGIAVLAVAAGSSACGEEGGTSVAPGSPGDAAGAGVGAAGYVAAGYDAAVDSARLLIDSLMAAEAIPGLSVAVGRTSEVTWSEGFGYADLTHDVKVTPETRFRVGSVSKPITAAALGLLLERGALDLDVPVQDYVPSFPVKRFPVTTRQLAGHLGGIRHYAGMENFSAVNYPDVLSGLVIFEDDPLINEPGTEFSYSSYAWNLISAVIEGASGESFLDFMNREVFGALGMSETMADMNRPIVPHRTRFYTRDDEGRVVNAPYVDNSYKWAGGGFISTPEDLLIFANGHFEPGYLQAETLEVLFTSQKTRDGTETGYGVGWTSSNNAHGQRIVSHGGGSVGGRTILTMNRDTGVIVAIVANLSSAPMTAELAGRIEELFGAEGGE